MLHVDARQTRDLARVGLQTGAAVALVYLAMSSFALDHLSWAIISALFSIQLSSDSTMSVALHRVIAALIGTALGLITVLVFQNVVPGSSPVLAALLTACVLANLMTTRWPSLNYISVAAAIVALDADADILEALERALAILVGSVGAAVASFVVWPETARARALRNIASAIDDCRRLVEASLGGLRGAEEEDTRKVDDDFSRHLATAREVVGDARFRQRLAGGRGLGETLVAIERLWHGTIVLDRAAEERSPRLHDADLDEMSERIDRIREKTATYLGDLVHYMEGRARSPPDIGDVAQCLLSAEDALRNATPETSLTDDPQRERAVAALRFGIDEFHKNLRELHDLLGPGREERERRSDRGSEQRVRADASG